MTVKSYGKLWRAMENYEELMGNLCGTVEFYGKLWSIMLYVERYKGL